MRTVAAYLFATIATVFGIGVLYYTFIAYFVFSVKDGYQYDGLNRLLYEPPWFVNLVYPGMQFPGYGYFVLDLVVFWGGVAIFYGLINIYLKLKGE